MFDYKIKQDCTIIYLHEDIDISTAHRMKEKFIKLIDENNYDKIIFNLRNVKFVDSSGISIFIKIKSMYDNRIELRICEVIDAIKKSFEYSHLNEFLGICGTEEEAIKSIINKD